MARLYGRSPTHQRCAASVPHGHWQSSTFIAALRAESIAAPFLIEGAVNAEVFTAYLAQVLCPELRRGDVVVLDNLAPPPARNSSGYSTRIWPTAASAPI
jgi:transposase